MLKQLKTLTKLELCNIYNLNVFRFSTDIKAKHKAKIMLVLWGILILMFLNYTGGLSYGLIHLGLTEIIPAYLITLSSLLIFFFGIFKAGNVIFRKNGFDILCSLPVTQTAIVASRFLRMYVENLMITLIVMIPGFAVYGWFVKPNVSFYLLGAFGILLVPLIPIAGAVLIGAVIIGISSRMKHKSLAASALSIILVFIIMLGSSQSASLEGNISPQMLKELSAFVFALLEKLYPPAIWLGNAIVQGDYILCLICSVIFLAIFAIVIVLVAVNFYSICRRLYGTSAKHNYEVKALTQNSVLLSLCKREFKRYFSSSVYVTNTILGPLMGTILSGALLFVDAQFITNTLPIPIDVNTILPFVLAGVFCIMTTTSTSISMEGNNWWIVKSLPLTTKSILDGKILMNLLLILPFYILSEILLMFALKPGILDFLWFLLIPTVIILFSCVYGITINLAFPVLNWDSEVTVVKQSASSMLGGLGGLVLAIICTIIVILTPKAYMNIVKLVLCIIVFVITAYLYHKNSTKNLQEL